MIYISEIFRKLKIMILALHITLMMDAANSEEIVHLMCVGSHHHQITVIHILQNLFQKGKFMRTASLNCHYFILMSRHTVVVGLKTNE
jgi:cobalamin biosynthesis Co2+ chelatase CbiK